MITPISFSGILFCSTRHISITKEHSVGLHSELQGKKRCEVHTVSILQKICYHSNKQQLHYTTVYHLCVHIHTPSPHHTTKTKEVLYARTQERRDWKPATQQVFLCCTTMISTKARRFVISLTVKNRFLHTMLHILVWYITTSPRNALRQSV